MTSILISTLIMGIIALVSGILITIAAKAFYVEPDKRIQQIFEMLPHFNCGACGTPGCEAMAQELVEGNISVAKCKPCKPEDREKIKEKMTELGLNAK